MGVSWHDLTFMLDPVLAEEVQAAWSWLVPEPWSPIVCAMVGGIFLETESGEVCWLDIGTAAVEEVAASAEEFEAILRSGEPVVEEWFLPALVESLHEAGKRAGPGEAYFFITLPIFAEGKYTADNMAVVPAREQLLATADVHRQIAHLPDRTKVRVVVRD